MNTWRAAVDALAYLQGKEFLEFQVFDYFSADRPFTSASDPDPSHHVALFGRTEEGYSVCVVAKTFPVVSIKLPSVKATSKLLKYIHTKMGLSQRDTPFRVVLSHNAAGFHPDQGAPADQPAFAKFPFLQIAFTSTALVWRVKKLLMKHKEGKPIPGPVKVLGITGAVEVVEVMIPPVLQFLQQTDISPSSHVQVYVSSLRLCGGGLGVSHCDLECTITVPAFAKPLSPIRPDLTRTLSNPIVVHSYDIEAIAPDGGFPDPLNPKDKVVAICSTTRRFGGDNRQLKVCHGLGAYHQVADADVCLSYETELELLIGWCEHVAFEDPDIMLGFNTHQFDDFYMSKRLGVNIPVLSRLRQVAAFLDESSFQSAAFGSNNFKRFVVPGRVSLDLYTYAKRNLRLDNYRLTTIAKAYLPGQDKQDLPIKVMMQYAQSGDPAKMQQVMSYCLQDTVLPILLVECLKVLSLTVEMSRVCSVFMCDILNRGQSIKVLSQLFRFARESNFILGNLPKLTGDVDTYQGATVLDCKTGFYDDSIVLDFASLYPSIMIGFNLCFSSIVMSDNSTVTPGVVYHACETDLGTFRVQQSLPGLLPRLLLKLLSARKVAKKDMAAAVAAGDQALALLMDGRQLALKVSCNSVYGFCGATTFGVYAYTPIAASVTAEGRKLIKRSIVLAEERFPVKVIYGDTDSIFCHPAPTEGPDRHETLFRMGAEMSKFISSHFPDAIKLEFEKVYLNLVLLGKKSYIGLKKESLEGKPKVESKGFASVRRDSSGFARNTLQRMIDKIVLERDLKGAVEVLHQECTALLDNRIDIEHLVLTRKLAGSYKNDNVVQFQVAKKMNTRRPGSAQVGDRIMFVVLAGKGELYEKGECVEHARDNKMALDRLFYLDGLQNPVEKLLHAFPNDIKHRALDLFHHHLAIATRQASNVQDIRAFLGIPVTIGEKRVFSENSEVAKKQHISKKSSKQKVATSIKGCMDLGVFFAGLKKTA